MKKIFSNMFLTAFVLLFIVLVLFLIFGVKETVKPKQYGKFDFHDKTNTLKWFSRHGETSPVTYTSVFSVAKEGDWLHVAAIKSEPHTCNDEGYSGGNNTFYLYDNELKYFLLNTKTGFNSGPLSEYQYVSECEGGGLRFRLKEEPAIFKSLQKKTIHSECMQTKKL